MKGHLLTFLFLLVAIAFYFVGMTMPAGVFILLGALAELTFWVRLFRPRKRRADCSQPE